MSSASRSSPDPAIQSLRETLAEMRSGLDDLSSKPSESFLEKVGGYVLAIPIFVPLLAGALLWQSYVLATVWNWFIPAIFGAPSLAMGSSLGVMLAFSAMRPSAGKAKESKFSRTMFEVFVGPAFTLGFAWCVRWAVHAGYLSF